MKNMNINELNKQKSPERYKILLISLALLAMFSCQKEGHLVVPGQFLNAKIYLGQKFSEINEIRDLRQSDSIIAYYEELENNLYFDRVYYKFSNNRLFEISFYKDIEKWDRNSDSLAFKILSICKLKYGKNDKIEEFKIGSKELKMPLLVWSRTNGYIEMSFIPLSYYKKVREKYSYIPTNITLNIKEKRSQRYNESKLFDRYF